MRKMLQSAVLLVPLLKCQLMILATVLINSCPNDLGYFITATMTTEEVSDRVDSMSDTEKYMLLEKHYSPNKHSIVPFSANKLSGSYRQFQISWLESGDYPWLWYSQYIDSAYCVYCVLFSTRQECKSLLYLMKLKQQDGLSPRQWNGSELIWTHDLADDSLSATWQFWGWIDW